MIIGIMESSETTSSAAPASSTELIVRSLTKAIVDHRLQPGAKLVEQKLADHYGVSRTLVRQALLQMSQHQNIM